MRCRFGHDHPPFAVRQPQNLVTGNEGKIHCFKCAHANGKRTIIAHWLVCSDIAKVRSLLEQHDVCRYCFPPPP